MKRISYQIVLAAVMGVCLLSGCGNKEKENKALLREAGIACIEQADYKGAIEAFEAALKQEVGTVDVDDLDISYYKAAAQTANGEIEAALATYDAILDFFPKEANAYYLRGCIYAKKADTEHAKADFSKAVTYNPKDYELYIHIYESLSGASEIEAAKEYLGKALTIKGEEVSDFDYRGRIYCLLGEYDNAIAELTAAKEKGSTTVDFWLAKVYAATGDVAQAERSYQAYFEQNESDVASLCSAGTFFLGEKQYEKAIAYYEEGLSLETEVDNRELLRNLVIAYENNGNFDKAWDLIQKYVALFPNDEEAQTEYLFLKNRQIKEVVEPETTTEANP